MGWFDWFRKEPAPVIDHPLFGRIQAAHRPDDRPWLWEAFEFLETSRGMVFVHLDAGEAGPSADHEAQWKSIVADADALSLAAAPLIAEELRDWEVPFDPAAPWDEITLEGAQLLGRTDPTMISRSFTPARAGPTP